MTSIIHSQLYIREQKYAKSTQVFSLSAFMKQIPLIFLNQALVLLLAVLKYVDI